MLRLPTLVAAALALVATASAQELDDLTAKQAAEQVRAGELSASALIERALAAAEADTLNALITVTTIKARTAAKALDAAIARNEPVGLLAGVPIVVKDNIAVASSPTTAGTPALADLVPQTTAPVVEALLKADAILIGKANLHELAFGITSNNAAYGPVGNALAPDRFAGGSSGGTASAVASHVALAGLGTDTGGSVRIPAALNGLVGLRPTTGRYPEGGLVPISPTRDTAGPIAKTVTDVALIDAVITGTEPGLEPADLSGVRLGLPRPLTENLAEGVEARFAEALAKLRQAGATLVEVDFSTIVARNDEVAFPIALFEARRDIETFLAQNATGVTVESLAEAIQSPDVKGVFQGAILGPDAPPEPVYRRAMDEVRPAMQTAYAALFHEHELDALVFPTTPLPAQPIEGSDRTVTLRGVEVPTFPTFIRNTDVGAVLGVPGLTVPMGLTAEGLPVGLEFDGRAGEDRALLSIGLAFEAL